MPKERITLIWSIARLAGVQSVGSNKLWGTLELESATGKNSACDGFGQK
ncbi:hypothetical protein VCRA2113O415_120105 [Vibrio crassostreae]|nr:hypothetical protein VCRA2113O415_120105 [Vibrio crassostreae]CAK3156692.1 hypothetical protein VCRA2121O436_130105 [Vibrio crassostreae]